MACGGVYRCRGINTGIWCFVVASKLVCLNEPCVMCILLLSVQRIEVHMKVVIFGSNCCHDVIEQCEMWSIDIHDDGVILF